MIRWIKKNLASQENINNSEKLMNYCHNSLFIRFSLSSFFKEIFSKHFIYSYNRDSHKVEHSSQASISSFRYSSFSSKFSRLINRWIDSSVSNKLFCGGESFYISYFGYKVRGSDIFESFDRFKDFKLIGMRRVTFFNEDVFNSLKFFLQNEESSDFTFKDFFIDGGSYSNRVFCGFKNLRGRKSTFSSSFLGVENLEDFLLRYFKECVFGWKREEEFEGREGKRVYKGEEFREEDMYKSFNFVFKGSDFLRDSLSFSCEDSKALRVFFLLWKIVNMDSQEFSYNGGVFPVGFSLSQGETREIRDKERVKDYAMEIMGVKKGEEVYVVGARGFHSNEDFRSRGAFRFKRVKESTEAFKAHRELRREKGISIFTNQSNMKRVFRDIDTTEKREHGDTSKLRFYEAGEASQSILHSDKGFQAQSTYEDLRRQVTNSFEGSKTQVKWSSPASSLLSYQAYKFININYS